LKLVLVQGIFSTVTPCSYVRGHLRGAVAFSSFFGQRSRMKKHERLLSEIEKHICLKIASANKQQFNLDYLSYLNRALISSLKQTPLDKGIGQCITLLDSYYLNRDDLQTMMELNTWGKTGRNLYEQLDTQMKASLTRSYNKTIHRTPYAIVDMKKLKAAKRSNNDDDDNDDDDEQESEVDETLIGNSLENDAMIKMAQRRVPKASTRKFRSK
jgi:replication factor C subunit 1